VASEEVIRTREELAEQMRALKDLAAMVKLYGFDILRPAANAQEAVQWTYFAYLGAIKEANGAAMSIGRISSFLDIYIERDIGEGTLDEDGAQELLDQLVQKLRIVRFLRIQRRSLLGNRMRWRHGSQRQHSRDQEQLPDAAHTHQSRASAGTEYYRAVVETHAGSLQALLRQGQPRYVVPAI